MVTYAKAEKIQPDAEDEVKKMQETLVELNSKAEDNMDAAKIVRNKLKSFLAAQ